MLIDSHESNLRAYLQDALPEAVDLLIETRNHFASILPEHTEAMRWKRAVFDKPGAKTTVKDCICHLKPQRKRVIVSIPLGVFMNDPDGILEGNHRYKREITIRKSADIYRPALRDILLQSYEFDGDRVLYKLLPNDDYQELKSKI